MVDSRSSLVSNQTSGSHLREPLVLGLGLLRGVHVNPECPKMSDHEASSSNQSRWDVLNPNRPFNREKMVLPRVD